MNSLRSNYDGYNIDINMISASQPKGRIDYQDLQKGIALLRTNFSHNRPAFSIKQKDRAILDLIGAYIQKIFLLEYCSHSAGYAATLLNRDSCVTSLTKAIGSKDEFDTFSTAISVQQALA